MESTQQLESDTNSSIKRNPFDNLSKDDLVKKCKGLLSIAQKAKLAKDECMDELKQLKDEINKFEIQKVADKDCMRTMQEVIDSLTQQKLSTTTSIDNLTKQVNSLEKQNNVFKSSISINEQRISDLDTENQAYKRQVVRLTDENDNLLRDMDCLEKKLKELSNISTQHELFIKNSGSDKNVMEQKLLTMEEEYKSALVEKENLEADKLRISEELTKIKNEVELKNQETLKLLEKMDKCSMEDNHIVIKLKNEIEKKDLLIDKLTNESAELSENLEKLKIEFDRKNEAETEKVNALRYSFELEKEDLNKRNCDYNSIITNLNLEIENNKNNLSSCESKISSLENDIIYYKSKLEEAEIKFTEFSKTVKNNGTKNFAKIQEENADLNEKLVNIQYELDNAKKYIEDLKKQAADRELHIKNINEADFVNNELKSVEKSELVKCKEQIEALTLKHMNSESHELNLKDRIKELNNKIESLKKEIMQSKEAIDLKDKEMIDSLKSVSDKFQLKVEQICLEVEEKESKIKDLQKYNVELDNKYKQMQVKLKTYRNKLIDFATNLKQLKSSKEILLDTIKDYSENVPKWQLQISNIAQNICGKLLQYEKENKELAVKVQYLEQENSNLNATNTSNTELVQDIQSLENNNKGLTEQIRILNEQHKELLQEKLNDLKLKQEKTLNTNEDLLVKLQILSNDNSLMSEEIKKLMEERSIMMQASNDFEKQCSENVLLKDLISNLKSENLSFLEKIENLTVDNASLSEKATASNIEITLLQKSCDNIRNELKNSNKERLKNEELLKNKADDMEHLNMEITDLNQRLTNKVFENDELLTEMREITDVLKERGETISQQQAFGFEMEKKIQTLENEVKKLNSSLDDYKFKSLESNDLLKQSSLKILQQQSERDSIIIEKETIIKNLKDELDRVNDRLNISVDAPSEVMSTSTISRVEDNARVLELDSSFEERYTKLRTLAMKLKKKVQELSAQVVLLETQNGKLVTERNEMQAKVNSMSVQAKNLQTLQQEYDKLQDDLEIQKNQEKSLERNLILIKQENEKGDADLNRLHDENEKLKKDIDFSKKEKSTLEMAVKEFQNQIQNLKKERETDASFKKEKDDQINALENQLSVKERELLEQKEAVKTATEQLEISKSEIKKKSVLSLEMDDYERTLNDLSQKLDSKNSKIRELESTVSTNINTISSLKDQIKLLEDSINSEQNHSKDLKEKLNITLCNLNESENKVSEKIHQISELIAEKECLLLKIEDINVDLTKNVADKENSIATLKTEKEIFLRQSYDLEEQIDHLKKSLSNKEQELNEIKTDFTSYKVRAQSVLRQNQNKDSGKEEELQQEIDALTINIDNLNLKLQKSSTQIETLLRDNMLLKDEKQKSIIRCDELLNILEELREQYDKLTESNKIQSQEYETTIKNQKLQNETLVNCYKEQINHIEEKYSNEMKDLKLRLDASQAIENLYNEIQKKGVRKISGSLANADTDKFDRTYIDAAHDDEGTEHKHSLSPNSTRRKISTHRKGRELIPLDELLNSTITNNETSSDYEGGVDRSLSPTFELEEVKHKLEKQECRVKHLTGLLSETEQDLAKLTQLNEVLKEEVRRHERSIEREQHTQNSEYLKNVLFKFMTLGTGDEKIHLVPVLNTMLKLSPEETQKLQAVARGVDSAGGRGWGSYLPLWNHNNQ